MVCVLWRKVVWKKGLSWLMPPLEQMGCTLAADGHTDVDVRKITLLGDEILPANAQNGTMGYARYGTCEWRGLDVRKWYSRFQRSRVKLISLGRRRDVSLCPETIRALPSWSRAAEHS
jgi:hypothetical protein